jgi:hypothetical protein
MDGLMILRLAIPLIAMALISCGANQPQPSSACVGEPDYSVQDSTIELTEGLKRTRPGQNEDDDDSDGVLDADELAVGSDPLDPDMSPSPGTINSSTRFVVANGMEGQENTSGYMAQPTDGFPPLLAMDSSFFIKFRYTREMHPDKMQMALLGQNKTLVRSFHISIATDNHWDSTLRNRVVIRFNDGVRTYESSELQLIDDVTDYMLFVVHSEQGIVASLYSATTGSALQTALPQLIPEFCLIPNRFELFGIGALTTGVEAGTASHYFSGEISDVGILNIPLSDTEKTLFSSGDPQQLLSAGYTDSVLYYRALSNHDGAYSFRNPLYLKDNSLPLQKIGYLKEGSTIGKNGLSTVFQSYPHGYIAGLDEYDQSKLRIEILENPSGHHVFLYRIGATENPVNDVSHIEGDDLTGGRMTNNEIVDSLSGWSTVYVISPGGSEPDYIEIDSSHITSWSILDVATDDLSEIYRFRNHFSSGIKIRAIGQSQMTIFAHARSNNLVECQVDIPATYIDLNREGRGYSRIMTPDNISDGLCGFVMHWQRNSDLPIAYIDDSVPGTGVHHWLSDEDTKRQWSESAELASVAGRDISVNLYQWVTSNLGASSRYGDEILEPLITGIPTLRVPDIDHYLWDDVEYHRADLVISPATGHRTSNEGPLMEDANGKVTHYARWSQIDWANEKGFTVGPFMNDIQIEASGGPHQDRTRFRGNPRMGIRLAETLLRWRGLTNRVDPHIKEVRFSSADQSVFDIEIALPNEGSELKTDGSDQVTGIELSEDGGESWSRYGFTAVIQGETRVRVTKDSGHWPENLQMRYQFGGPFSYGTSVGELELIRGSLYDGTDVSGSAWDDHLGLPVISTHYPLVVHPFTSG